MKLYISGPMRGKPLFNFPAFDEARNFLEKFGHTVISPADLDRERGFDPNSDGYDFDVNAALKRDILAIVNECDGIYLLDGWELSDGANIELTVADAVGLDLFTELSWPVRETIDNLKSVRNEARLALNFEYPNTEIRVKNPTTGGEKGSKLARFDLIPGGPMWTVAELYGKGAEKYEPRNWERGYAWSLSIAALERHFNQFKRGQYLDDETNLPHLAAVVFHALALMEFNDTHPELDDRATS